MFKRPRYTLRPGTAIFSVHDQLWLFCRDLKPFRVNAPTTEARALLDNLRKSRIPECDDIYQPLISQLIESQYLVDSSLWDTIDETFERQIRYLACRLPADQVPVAQRSLAMSHVVVLGVGSLGSAVALQLAAAGCQNLKLIDYDAVEPSNLARQIAFSRHDLGTKKAHAVRRLIEPFGPGVIVTTHDVRITSAAVLEGIVSPETALLVNTADEPPLFLAAEVTRFAHGKNIALLHGNSAGIGPVVFSRHTPSSRPCPICFMLYGWPERELAQIIGTRSGEPRSASGVLVTDVLLAAAILADIALKHLFGLPTDDRKVQLTDRAGSRHIRHDPRLRHPHCKFHQLC